MAAGRPYLRALRSHWLVAALFVAAVVAASVVVLGLRSPTYEATAELLVSPVDPTDTNFSGLSVVQELGDPTRTIQTAAALVENREIADAAADRLGGPWTGGRVADAVTVSPQGQTNVLEIRASTDDASDAADVANAYAAAVIDVRGLALQDDVDRAVDRVRSELAALNPGTSATREVLQQRAAQLELLRVSGDPTVSFVEPAAVPSSSSGLPRYLVVGLAAAAALVLAPGVAWLVELAGPRRVRRDEDLADTLAAPALALVPRHRRGRPRADADVPSIVADDEDVRAAYRSLAVHLAFGPHAPHSAMVVSPSRADGRTTVAANLARELARVGSKVALADLDRAKPDLAAAMADGPLTVLRVDPDHDGPGAYASPAELISDASKVYDHVVIDTPPLLGADDLLPLSAAVDTVIVVARSGHTLLARLQTASDLLRTVGAPPTAAVLLAT
jgi:Mrp family chromosome partitioning ATPase